MGGNSFLEFKQLFLYQTELIKDLNKEMQDLRIKVAVQQVKVATVATILALVVDLLLSDVIHALVEGLIK